MNPTCPRTEQIRDFVAGTLLDSDSDILCTHVDNCTLCQESLDTATRNSLSHFDLPRVHVNRLRQNDADELNNLILRMRHVCEGDTASHSLTSNTGLGVPESLGEYDIMEELGRGGMGTVYRARHRLLDRIDAVKVISADRMETDRQVQRFRREMANVAKLHHPNFVHAYTAGVDNGQHFLAMEFVNGPTVSQLLRSNVQLSIAAAAEIGRQTAVGLQVADDAQLVHRDIKPSNLMIDGDGTVRILDLGLAVSVVPDNETISEPGLIVGTLDYIAPEQIQAQGTVDIRADLYGLGCTLFRLLTGRPPYLKGEGGDLALLDAHLRQPIPSAQELRNEIPPALSGLVEALLAKDRNERPNTATEVAERLRPFSDGAELTAFVHEHKRTVDSPHEFSEQPTMSALTTDHDRRALQSNSATNQSNRVTVWCGRILATILVAALLLTLVIRIRGVDVVLEVNSTEISSENISVRIGEQTAPVENSVVTLRLPPGGHTFEIVTPNNDVVDSGQLTVHYFGSNILSVGQKQPGTPKNSPSDMVTEAVQHKSGSGIISGSLFHDRDGNGQWDSGESAVGGQVLWLLTPDRKAVLLPSGIEPDDYPRNMDVSTIDPRVVLSAIGNEAASSTVHVDRRDTSSTGTQVFEITDRAAPDLHHSSIFRATRKELQAVFAAPVKSVRIDIVGKDDGSVGRLSAFRPDGSLLRVVESKTLTEGKTETIEVSSDDCDIASVIATGDTSEGVRLDNLRFTWVALTTSQADGSFRFDGLNEGQYHVEVGTRKRLPVRTQVTSVDLVAVGTINKQFGVSERSEFSLNNSAVTVETFAADRHVSGGSMADMQHVLKQAEHGWSRINRGHYREAEKIFNEVKLIDPDLSSLGLGWCYLGEGRFGPACDYFASVSADRLPKKYRASWYDGYGKSLIWSGDQERGKAVLQGLIDRPAEVWEDHKARMEAFALLNDFEQAGVAATAAKEVNPETADWIDERLRQIKLAAEVDSIITQSGGMRTTHFAFVSDLPYAEWDHLAYAMSAIGLYPTRIRPLNGPTGVRMSVVFHRDAGSVQIIADQTAEGITRKINTLQNAGLLLHDVAGYAEKNSDRYFATLITNHESFGPAEFFVGVAEGRHSDRHGDFVRRGWRVRTRQFFRSHDGTIRHSGIWVPPGDTPKSSSVFHGQSALDRIAKEYPMADVDLRTNDDGDNVVLSGCFRRDADWKSTLCGPTDSAAHLTLCREQADRGFIPLTVSTVHLPKSGRTVMVSVWKSK